MAKKASTMRIKDFVQAKGLNNFPSMPVREIQVKRMQLQLWLSKKHLDPLILKMLQLALTFLQEKWIVFFFE
jgi:hypothetical protein